MSDQKKNKIGKSMFSLIAALTFVFCMMVMPVSAATVTIDDFESGTLASNWTSVSLNSAFDVGEWAISPWGHINGYSGYSVMFNADDAAFCTPPDEARLVTPLDLSYCQNSSLTFYYACNDIYNDLQVEVSTDGGSSWTPLGASIEATGYYSWTLITRSLSDFDGEEILLGFRSISSITPWYMSYNTHLDDIALTYDDRFDIHVISPTPAQALKGFKLGSTIPVKFQLTDSMGELVDTSAATLTYAPSGSDEFVAAVSTDRTVTDNSFRYLPDTGEYIFNLSTKTGFQKGVTYDLKITLDNGQEQVIQVKIVK